MNKNTDSKSGTMKPGPAAAKAAGWGIADYVPFVQYSGAAKLADSGVAPLIAVARGYTTATTENLKSLATDLGVGDSRTAAFRQFKTATERGGDALVLPWFSLTQVLNSSDGDAPLGIPTIQLRPSVPLEDSNTGKIRKYEFLQGSGTVLDLHPTTPTEWSTTTRSVLIAEGILKGDSVLTAILLEAGMAPKDLAVHPHETKQNAIDRLRNILAKIPAEKRVLIINIAGVTNWANKSSWNDLDLRRKTVTITFDGDLATNINVYNQAVQLMQHLRDRGAMPELLDLNAATRALTANGIDVPHGFGVDDYLAHHGTWSSLKPYFTEDLPLKPDKKHEPRPGEFRVSPRGTEIEEYCRKQDAFGNTTASSWETRTTLGGRIVASEIRRTPTSDELATGIFDDTQTGRAVEATCTIEVAWWDDDYEAVDSCLVTGPHAILNYDPRDWDRHGAAIPALLTRQPAWPPHNGRDWLRAIKGNRADEIDTRTIWDTMGWVPVEGDPVPSFIIGGQSIATDDNAVDRTIQGVQEDNLDGAAEFGIADKHWNGSITDTESLRIHLESLMSAFIDDAPWKTPEIAATVLAAGIRPVIPRRPHTTLYLTGPAQKGKSYTAQCIMAFYAAKPGVWSKKLPGSAKDTFTSIESAVSRTPIWVIDDLAPTTDRRQSDQEQSTIGDIIRATANGAGKRRSTYDAKAQRVSNPRALLIVTGENEHPVPSVRERCIAIEFDGLVSKNVETMRSLAHGTDLFATITGATVRLFIDVASATSWSDVTSSVESQYQEMIFIATSVFDKMGVSSSQHRRQLELAADLMIGLLALRQLAESVGLHARATDLYDPDGDDSLVHRVARQVAHAHRDKSLEAPGRILMDCIAQSLISGTGHLKAAHDQGAHPTIDIDGRALPDSMYLLGWKQGPNDIPISQGNCIGYVSTHKATGEQVVFIRPDVAFNLAKKENPDKIPFGSSPKTWWRNVWDPELNLIASPYRDTSAPGFQRQVRGQDGLQLRGVPILMSSLFDPAAEAEDAA